MSQAIANKSAQYDLIEAAANELGFARINPESLTEIRAYGREYGWYDLARRIGSGSDGSALNAAFRTVMADIAALFAPA